MKTRLVDFLACPSCRGGLSLTIARRNNADDVLEGHLACGCGAVYGIRGGVPHFSVPPAAQLVDEGQVAQSFGVKWTGQPRWGLQGRTAEFMRQWVLGKYGWQTERDFHESVAHCSVMLDAGTGLGREVRHLAAANPSAEVVGLDVSESVTVATTVVADLPRAHIVQGDVLAPPFGAVFDFIFSEGVLHHTTDTRAAVKSLVACLAPGGEIAFYVYRRKGPLRELADDKIREYVSRLTPEDAWAAVEPLTLLGRALAELKAEIDIPRDIPVLGISAGTYDVQRLFYNHVMKCFWNPEFTFDENNLINFDWYHPALAHRHSADEVRGWIDELGLELFHLHEEPSGITVRARCPGKRSG